MTFADAKAAIRAHIATQWAAGAYADVAVLWENESPEQVYDRFVFVSIDGVDARKTVYGAAGKRMSKEDGIVFIHAFVPQGIGTSLPDALVGTMTAALELRVIPTGVNMDGANPQSHADLGDTLTPGMQPGGNYYRVTGSVPFFVISTV